MILLRQVIPLKPGQPSGLVTVRRNAVNPDNIERVVQEDTGCTIVFTSGAAVEYQNTVEEVVAMIE